MIKVIDQNDNLQTRKFYAHCLKLTVNIGLLFCLIVLVCAWCEQAKIYWAVG